jgi:hypothetical protein
MKRKFVHIESNDLAVLATILIIWNSSVPTFFRGERAVEAQIPNVCQARLV